ncbi:putative prophage CPS-53 integrase [Caedimonas varicaedens]|uniref:Putative prophage CPS-53 integrase n=1 Tax=Caedimonas varicaedens TaxID=1629334 RepID=A0A0K8MEB2_9PROT|nr:putative prophage CPS-53 integrase [Caedimonas varicaedens]
MQRVILTQSMIEKAKPKARIFSLKDAKVPGLEFVTNPRGTQSWFVRAFKQKILLGRYPFMSLEDARKMALQVYVDLQKGVVPLVKKKEEKNKNITVNQLVEEFFQFRSSGTHALEESTMNVYKKAWVALGSETIGSFQISELTDVTINQVCLPLMAKYSRVKCLQNLIHVAFQYGFKMGYPVAVLNSDNWLKGKGEGKERYFYSADVQKLETQTDFGLQKDSTDSSILHILMYTGCRVTEILELQWNDISLENGYFKLRKTKTKKQRVVPISGALREIFLRLQTTSSTGYVFKSLRDANAPYNYFTLIHFWRLIMKQAGFNTDGEKLTIHSLRHTFVTVGNRIKVSPFTLQDLVGHSRGRSVTAGYIHPNLAELAEAQQSIISAIQSGSY